MLICIFARSTVTGMSELDKADGYGIGEEEIAGSAPMVRALLVQRLEQVWATCEPHVTGVVKPDPRFIEAGIRVLDRLERLYRLSAPTTAPDAALGADTETLRALAEEQLAAIEAKQREEQG